MRGGGIPHVEHAVGLVQDHVLHVQASFETGKNPVFGRTHGGGYPPPWGLTTSKNSPFTLSRVVTSSNCRRSFNLDGGRGVGRALSVSVAQTSPTAILREGPSPEWERPIRGEGRGRKRIHGPTQWGHDRTGRDGQEGCPRCVRPEANVGDVVSAHPSSRGVS